MSKLLPEDLEEQTLDKMLPGERAWTVPWGMWVDRQRQCWLHPGYTVHSRRGGTVEMLVRRLEDGSFEVDVRGLNHRWASAENPGYVGDHGAWLAVSNLIT